MRKVFRVGLARRVFDTITKFGVVSPQELTNACLLLDIPLTIDRKNRLLMYFMMKEQNDPYDRFGHPTRKEIEQIKYIGEHMGDDLKDYIARLDVDDDRTFDKTQLLDVVFSAADTSEPQSHSEDTAESIEAEIQFKPKARGKRKTKKK